MTAQTFHGLLGPYLWQLNGKTTTGSWYVTCLNDNNALVAKGYTSLTMIRP